MYRKSVFLYMLTLALTGCASKPIIQTRVIEKPIPVPCHVEIPEECKEAYSVDRVSPADNALTINRALRAEIEERAACEVKLRAAVKGCNQSKPSVLNEKSGS
ncbi:hypothetical protein [Nitrosospira multiformis]|nr:hypothetical protein [Nitrosospira multiformis]